jgi:hypothetical protein
MLKSVLLLTCAAIVLCACGGKKTPSGTDPNRYVSVEDTLLLPFDTSRVLQLYDTPLHALSANAPEKLDTFVLIDMMYACDCPRWTTEEELKQIEHYNSLDPMTNRDHDVFYLESGAADLRLPETFSVRRNRIRFYGKVRTRSGWPNVEFTDPGPPPGPVLTVYGYEVILPAYIYGPPVHIPDSTGKTPRWAQNEMTVLEVTERNYGKRHR